MSIPARFILAASAAAIAVPLLQAASSRPASSTISEPRYFERNLGQTHSEVAYQGRAGKGLTAFLTHDGDATLAATSGAVARLKLLGRVRPSRWQAGEPLPGRSNYFRGQRPERWVKDVPHFSSVTQEEALSGVNWRFHFARGALEFDFLLSPGADPGSITLLSDRAPSLDNGALLLKAGSGPRESAIRLAAPQAFLLLGDGSRRQVECSYTVDGRHIGFRAGEYDRSLPLLIDPVVTYSTYLGGSASDAPSLGFTNTRIAVGASGSFFVGGLSESSNFPTTSGAFDRTFGNLRDLVVSKFTSSGALSWSTYLGGTDSTGGGLTFEEFFGDLAIDGSGRAHVIGSSADIDFPVVSPIQAARAGGEDIVVATIASGGNSLVFSTYLGGANRDYGQGIALDSSGNRYICGTSSSSNFPTTSGARDTTANGGKDGIIAKITAANALGFSTYLGGVCR